MLNAFFGCIYVLVVVRSGLPVRLHWPKQLIPRDLFSRRSGVFWAVWALLLYIGAIALIALPSFRISSSDFDVGFRLHFLFRILRWCVPHVTIGRPMPNIVSTSPQGGRSRRAAHAKHIKHTPMGHRSRRTAHAKHIKHTPIEWPQP